MTGPSKGKRYATSTIPVAAEAAAAVQTIHIDGAVFSVGGDSSPDPALITVGIKSQ